jgi:hypothetical protein
MRLSFFQEPQRVIHNFEIGHGYIDQYVLLIIILIYIYMKKKKYNLVLRTTTLSLHEPQNYQNLQSGLPNYQNLRKMSGYFDEIFP